MRLTPEQSGLCVVDVQEKIIPTIPTGQHVITECCRLIDAANLFDTPIIFSEQYPKGLGQTVTQVATRISQQKVIENSVLAVVTSQAFWIRSQKVETIILSGIETHICIAQTALDLLKLGFRVCIAVDAVGSRREHDHTVALRRLETAGAVLSTTEAILFELCATAENAAFKKMQQLIEK